MRKSKAVFITIGIVTILFFIFQATNQKEPVIFASHGLLRELSLDDKIQESQLIIVGEVVTALPSKWRLQHQKEADNALPQEILREGGLFTDFLIKVNVILKGDIKEKMIRVRSFTGETKSVRWESDNEPDYSVGQSYLLFLIQDYGPTTIVDAGDYISVNSNSAIYEINDGKAISADDEWLLEDLIAYIEQSLSSETPPSDDVVVETPTPFTTTPTFTLTLTELLTETPLPEETPTVMP